MLRITQVSNIILFVRRKLEQFFSVRNFQILSLFSSPLLNIQTYFQVTLLFIFCILSFVVSRLWQCHQAVTILIVRLSVPDHNPVDVPLRTNYACVGCLVPSAKRKT